MILLRLEDIGAANRAYVQLMAGVIDSVMLGMSDAVTGDRRGAMPRPWVARVVGRCPKYGVAREFLRPMTDYGAARGTGNRGLTMVYALTDGLYDVNERTSWRKWRRYFLRVTGEQSSEIDRDEVLRCLSEG